MVTPCSLMLHLVKQFPIPNTGLLQLRVDVWFSESKLTISDLLLPKLPACHPKAAFSGW